MAKRSRRRGKPGARLQAAKSGDATAQRFVAVDPAGLVRTIAAITTEAAA